MGSGALGCSVEGAVEVGSSSKDSGGASTGDVVDILVDDLVVASVEVLADDVLAGILGCVEEDMRLGEVFLSDNSRCGSLKKFCTSRDAGFWRQVQIRDCLSQTAAHDFTNASQRHQAYLNKRRFCSTWESLKFKGLFTRIWKATH